MDKKFGNVIWTNHAIRRCEERGISQSDAWATWRKPQQSRFAKSRGGWIFYRTYGDQRIEVVAKQNERKEWIILSVWSKHVKGGKADRKKKEVKAKPLWKNMVDMLLGR